MQAVGHRSLLLIIVASALAGVACGEETGGAQLALAAPAAGEGFQVGTEGISLPAYADDEWCEAVVVPGTPDQRYAIQSFDVAMTPHYHHLFVAKAPAGSVSEGLMEVGKPVRCVGGAHVTYGSDLIPIPLPQGDLVHVEYPDGVGLVVHGGQKISINYHYLNTSDHNVPARVKLNFNGRVIDPNSEITELQQFGFYNQDIHIPAHGTYSSTWSVTFSQDVYVRDLFRHTHGLGTDVPVSHYTGSRNGGPMTGDLIFTSTDYQNDPGWTFQDPLLVRAGNGFTFTCNWLNDRDYPVAFGPTADDEMCMLLGTWWVADPNEAPEVQDKYKFTPTGEQ